MGVKFSALGKVSSMNILRRNVSLLKRNLPTKYINTGGSAFETYNDILYYKVPVGTQITGIGGKMNNANVRTLVIEGGDAVIDSDISIDLQIARPRSIIVISDANGNGGNIYIKDSVKNIYSSLVAEGSIYT